MSQIELVVAYAEKNRAIGKNNQLLWSLPEDLKNFSNLTRNSIVIMGRKTFDSLPAKFRPLPNRLNVVISRQTDLKYPETLVYNDLSLAVKNLQKNYPDKKIFIIGGSSIYEQALNLKLVDILHISKVFGDWNEADSFFPEINFENWKLENQTSFDGFVYEVWKKNDK